MDDDQQFCLRWNNHQSTLVAVFDTLLENGTLVDCTLAAEGKFLNAHKVVLSACSPYFEALLSRHYDKHPILILKDVKFQELKAMMDYMYRGEVNISQDQLGALLKAAESLQIKGLSDNKKDEPPAKRPAPAPAAPKSPQPQAQLPKVQGLTIEQRSRDDREGSMSPGPRKKKRMRRKSEEMDNHDASNSSDASHSMPAQNIPSATSQLSTAKLNSNNDLSDQIETKQEILTRHKEETGSQQTVPMIKEKIETHTELMLEPKSEYVEEMNEDSIEDLTLDDDDISNMEQVDEGAGPSHGGEGSSQQGFGHWQMGNQSQDEVFLAAQEAVGAHRDSQGVISQKFKKFRLSHPQEDFQRRSGYFTSRQAENHLAGDRRLGAANVKQKQSFRNEDIHQLALKAQKLVEDIRSSGGQKETGLLTDSLSCIFTRRPKKNNQHKTPQKRVFFEEVREEDTRPKNTEPVQRPQYLKKDGSSCPRPPTISQKYVDNNWSHLSMEEEAQENNCPEPPVLSTRDKSQITHDASLDESNVSPYVPKNKFDVDEYTKYKTEQLEKESKYKHGDTSPRYQQVEEPDNDDGLNGEDYDELSKYDIASYAISSGNTRFGKNVKEKDYYDEPVNYERESYYKDFAEYRNKRQSSEYEEREVADICPQAPHISPQPSEIEQEPDHSDLAPEAPAISEVQRSYYEKPSSLPPKQPCETQKKCPRCSFQTTNLKRLKGHLKFVHGETEAHGVEEQPPKKAGNELFSRREPKVVESELFSRRQYARRDEVPVEDAGIKKKQFPGGFKRRNTAVNVISTEVLIPARKDTVESERLETAEDDYDDEASELRKEAGVLAAMEYFETSKDQPKKPRPYKRNADDLLDDDWF